MALRLHPTDRDISSTSGKDHFGLGILTLTRRMVAGGFWKRINQGDGQGEYSSGTADLFTANGGLGYATSGSWNAAVANSFSHSRAYIHLAELDGAAAVTGREVIFQRGTGTGAGADRLVNVAFSWTGLTGSPDAVTAPTTGSYAQGLRGSALNSAGGNVFSHLTTSPQMGGSGGTIRFHIFDCEALSAGDVAPWGIVAYDETADDLAFFFIYDALLATGADSQPCVLYGADVNTGAWAAAETTSATPTLFNNSGASQVMWATNAAGTVSSCALQGMLTPDGVTRPGSSNLLAVNADGKLPIMPAIVTIEGSTSEWKGVSESVRIHYPPDSGHLLGRYYSATADAIEPPRWSLGHILVPGEVGWSPAGITSTNYTDGVTVLPVADEPDATPPTIGSFSPASGAIAYGQAITVPVTDNLGELALIFVTVQYAGQPDEVVYDGTSLSSDYDAASIIPSLPAGGTVTVDRDVGWPGAFTLRVHARDLDGNATTSTAAYTISTVPNPAAPDTTVPTVGNISPAPASFIDDDEVIEFDVTDVGGLSYFAVLAKYLDKRDYDVVWDGADFGAKYAGSTVDAISYGYHFAIVRDFANVCGWASQGRVRFKAVAIDAFGNAEVD